MSNFYDESKVMFKVCKAKTYHKIINTNGVATRRIEGTNVGSRNASLKQMFLRQVIVILLLKSRTASACWGGSGEYDERDPEKGDYYNEYYEEEKDGTSVTHVKDHIERNKIAYWGAWTAPPHVDKHWRDWLNHYELKHNNTDFLTDENRERIQKEREGYHFWPPSWKDLGEGNGGGAPPPWAYVSKNTGKPEACYRRPKFGKCNEEFIRWGWNTMLNKCLAYKYSGCGGSLNLFDTEELCKMKCLADPPPSCDSDSGIPIGDV